MISIVLGGKFINFLKKRQLEESIRDDGPKTHLSKQGTPTMGGVFIVVSV
ncbi:MAG: phospho-N-acetylmuramoyl-pentapeptide-transferase, partial [Candidatus Dadabacteria bacterium]|nr:phospho-N-acetylmuramoyl-pentapeptide-transferase [Candidatus Dadabacteria bacterium]NIX14724.1 phospho-N-acetylmuramoyl-pentapeptide-transferase [Candidatus Dadabacteria bacterium]